MLPKLAALRAEAERRSLDLPIGVDGGVNEETIASAYHAGGTCWWSDPASIATPVSWVDVVEQLRATARRRAVTPAVSDGAPA